MTIFLTADLFKIKKALFKNKISKIGNMKSLTEQLNESLVNESMWTDIRKKNINVWKSIITVLNGSHNYDKELSATLLDVLQEIIDNKRAQQQKGHLTTYDYTMWICNLCADANGKHNSDDFLDLICKTVDDNRQKIPAFKNYDPEEEE